MGLRQWAAAGAIALGASSLEGCIFTQMISPLIGKLVVNGHLDGIREKYEPGQASQPCLESEVEAKHGVRILGRHTLEDVVAVDTVLSRLPKAVVEPIEDIYILKDKELLGSPFAAGEAHPETMSICVFKEWTDLTLAHEAMHIYHFQLLKNANPKTAHTLPTMCCSDHGCEMVYEHDAHGEMPDITVDKPQCEFEKEWFAVKKKYGKEQPRKEAKNPGEWKDGFPGPRNLCARPYGATNKMEDVATQGEEIYNLCYNKAFGKGKRLVLWARLYPTDEKKGYDELVGLLHKYGFLSDEDHAYAEKNLSSDYEKYKKWMNKYEYFYPADNPWGNRFDGEKK